MQAIIIAAGKGKRLSPLTDDTPKCMLHIGDMPIIQHQINTLRSAGVERISIIKGYCQKKIQLKDPDISYFFNEDYQNNNILESLFYAEEAIIGDVIILYSDIIFEKGVVEKLFESSDEISIMVDVDWKNHYVGRRDHPIEEAEAVILGNNGEIQQIGKVINGEKAEVFGEFIGMIKLCGNGPEIFKSFYHQSKNKYKGKQFQKAESIKVAYLTDLIQEMVDNAIPISCVRINNGWREIDTLEDLENAADFFN
jgi:L-glutamine-phosphate cytidylyltransferase